VTGDMPVPDIEIPALLYLSRTAFRAAEQLEAAAVRVFEGTVSSEHADVAFVLADNLRHLVVAIAEDAADEASLR
jgi:hypothetical protein